jgi:Immunity protein 35
MFDLAAAREVTFRYLSKMAENCARFGSALPGWEYRPERFEIVIVSEEEFDFGWVFSYQSRRFVDTGDERCILGGNAPLIFDRHDGQLYVTGTVSALSHYIEDYRKGISSTLLEKSLARTRPLEESRSTGLSGLNPQNPTRAAPAKSGAA